MYPINKRLGPLGLLLIKKVKIERSKVTAINK